MSRGLNRAIPGSWRLGVVGLSLAALASVGCKGAIGDQNAGATGSAASSGGGGSTGAGASSTTGTGTAGAAGPSTSASRRPFAWNNTQYNNTVHDLLGTSLTPASNFPADETSLGFDTIGGTLLDQPERQQAYLSASSDLINELFARPVTNATYKSLISCDYTTGATCQKTILTAFAAKAWRRPVVDAEIAPYMTLAAGGATPKDGMIAAMRAVLMSASFLYRLEHDPDPSVTALAPHRLNAYELATRLSYVSCGRSMPDATLTGGRRRGLDPPGRRAPSRR